MHLMVGNRVKLLTVQGFVIALAIGGGWFAHESAAWLVGHDRIYLRIHHSPLHFVCMIAEVVNSVSVVAMLVGGAALGLLLVALQRQMEADRLGEHEVTRADENR